MKTMSHSSIKTNLWSWDNLGLSILLSIILSPVVIAIMGVFIELNVTNALTAFGATMITMVLMKITLKVLRD